MTNPDKLAKVIQHWLDHHILALGLCPFALPVMKADKLALRFVDGDTSQVLHGLYAAWTDMLAVDNPETLLLVVDDQAMTFDDFLDLLAMAEALLDETDLAEHFSLVSFHPHYQHAGFAESAPENYSNRSPLPVVQILRQTSLAGLQQADADGADATPQEFEGDDALALPSAAVEAILEKNSRTLNQAGASALQATLDQCWLA